MQNSEKLSMSNATTPKGLVLSPEELRYRQIVPGLATPEECARLVSYAEKNLIVGDGYGGDANPHTQTETFYGFTVVGAPAKQPDPDHVLCLDVIKRARRAVMRHFGLRFLWLDYAHMVKREPIPGKAHAADELSHPWHYDDQSDHVKHRTHTAILYLNDQFEGGLTQFKEASFGPFRQVQPETGKMIAFDVAHNAHAVSKLVSGERYVVNMWFSTHMKIWRRHRRILGLF
jgi:hypothetical protein